ncbi:unnamed protein product [Closterium sp. NIES-53]
MDAQELRWLTYLLTDLGEAPRSPPVLYVDNKAMLALCREHRLEHRTKHIALRYFLARELQQHGQLCLAYVATRANTADIFTKALQPYDHQRFCTVLGLQIPVAAPPVASSSAQTPPPVNALPDTLSVEPIDDGMPSSSNTTTPMSTSFPISGRESDRPAVSIATTTTLRASFVLPDRASLKAKYKHRKLNFARPAVQYILSHLFLSSILSHAPAETTPPATRRSANDDDDEDEEKDVSGKRRQLSLEELQLKCMEQWLCYFPWL